MDLSLNGKTALVTGSTAGIGFAIARALLQEGASLIVCGQGEDDLLQATNSLSKTKVGEGRIVGTYAGDLSSAKQVIALATQFPKIEILVNNVGYYESKELADLEVKDWEQMYRINVLSGAILAQAYLPKMKAAGWGRIIFIGSDTAVNVPPDMIHYAASKSAQMTLGRGLAEMTAGTEVTVNTVLPGPTGSERLYRLMDELLGTSEKPRQERERDFIEKFHPNSLIKRFVRVEEVASMVTYLASPLSAAINGAAIKVEGGMLRNVI